jgi:hypothetical protein
MVMHAYNMCTWKTKAEDFEFQATLGYIETLSQKKKKNAKWKRYTTLAVLRGVQKPVNPRRLLSLPLLNGVLVGF